jgi:flagellar export protein FliJ
VSTRFAFRLARLLRHRRHVEEARALAVRGAIERRETALARQATLERAATHVRASLNAACVTGLTGASVRLRAEGARDLLGRARAAAAVAAAEADRVDERRAELVEAAQQRRALERLEGIQRAAWQAAMTRNDQRVTDDIATSRYGRSS